MLNLKDPIIMRQVIVDNYSLPSNKGLLKQKSAITVHQISESCIDNIYAELLIKKNKIISAQFDGIGCAISTASSNICAKLLVNLSVVDGLKLTDNYFAMLNEQSFDEKIIGELIVFSNVPKQANRLKCARIGVAGFEKILKQFLKGN